VSFSVAAAAVGHSGRGYRRGVGRRAAGAGPPLTLLTGWLSGSHKQTLAGSFAAFIGHPAYNTDTLCADLHRFAFLLGASDGEELFGEPTP
jgi:hypothetical protein